MQADFKRNIKSGIEYDKYFPKPNFKREEFGEGRAVGQTIKHMKDYIIKYKSDTAKIAPILKGKTLLETLENDWNFVYNHIQYKIDTPGYEELRRPAMAWADRSTGVDCDCYTIFLSTLLLNQGIEPIIRIVKIPPADSWHHVYPIVKTDNGYVTVDCVVDKFNYETPYGASTNKKDFTMSGLGIPIVGLNGINGQQNDNNDYEVLLGSLDGGLGSTDKGLLQHLVATRNIVGKNPAEYGGTEAEGRFFIEQLDYAIKFWNTPLREKALEKLADTNMGSLDGKHHRFKHFWNKVKNHNKKVLEAVKKGVKFVGKVTKAAVLTYNPVVAAVRGGFLMAIALNMFKMKTTLKWAYSTPQQRKQHNISASTFNKLTKAINWMEKAWDNMGGDKNKLKNAILHGKKGSLNGGLGVVATAASVTAASGFIAKVVSVFKKIGIFAKKTGADKLLNKIGKGYKLSQKDIQESQQMQAVDRPSARPQASQGESQNIEPDYSPEPKKWYQSKALKTGALVVGGITIVGGGIYAVTKNKSSIKKNSSLNGADSELRKIVLT